MMNVREVMHAIAMLLAAIHLALTLVNASRASRAMGNHAYGIEVRISHLYGLGYQCLYLAKL